MGDPRPPVPSAGNPEPGVGYGQQGQQQHTVGRPMSAPVYGNRGQIVKNEAPARIIPIAALNPNFQGRWTIRAWITSKTAQSLQNANGVRVTGNFDLLDAYGGEIRATCFDDVVDQFYDRVHVGKVYLISKGSLQAAETYNHLKNSCELFLGPASVLEPCYDEDSLIPKQVFDFKPISDVETLENNAVTDIMGVVLSINPTNTISRKNGIETQKRSLRMKDRSGKSVELTMWGAYCNKEGRELEEVLHSGAYPVLAVKSGRVRDFSGGKFVSTIPSTQFFIDPDHPEAHNVREWFDGGGQNAQAVNISARVATFGEAYGGYSPGMLPEQYFGCFE